MGISAYAAIRMADGSEKRAEDIAKGDRILSALTGQPAAVTRVLNGPGVGMITLTDADGNRIDVTGDQPGYTDGGFVDAHRIRPGMQLRTERGMAQCSAAGPLAGDYMVYDFRADGDTPAVFASGFILGV